MRHRHHALTAIGVSLLGVTLAACSSGGDGLPHSSSKELGNVVKAVDKANPDTTWWDHVSDVQGGVFADAKITTDYPAEKVDSYVQAVKLCEAFVKAIQTDEHFVVIYGKATTHTKKIDGTVKDKTQTTKLAQDNPGDDGTCEAISFYDSITDELDDMGVDQEPFASDVPSPGYVKG